MASYGSVSQILAEFHAGNLTWIQLPPLIVNMLSEQNVDAVLQQLPDDIRRYFLDFAQHTYLRDDVPLVTIGRGPPAPVSRAGVLAIRAWLERNSG